MSKPSKNPTDKIKRSLFGGLSQPEVAKLLEDAAKDQARVQSRLDAAQSEVQRAQNELETRGLIEAQLRAQLDSFSEDAKQTRAALEAEIAELRNTIATATPATPEFDTSAFETQIVRLTEDLELANQRLAELPYLQQELESLRVQLAEGVAPVGFGEQADTSEEVNALRAEVEYLRAQLAEQSNQAATYGDLPYGSEPTTSDEVEGLKEEIERLRSQLNGLPDLHEQIAALQSQLMASEAGAELERAYAEIERLNAELTNVPSLLEQIESLRSQLTESPAFAETEELRGLRAEVERLHLQHGVVSETPVDLDRSLVEARKILDEARNEAARERVLIIEAAHHHAEEIIRRAQRQFSTEAWEIEKIRLERRRYLSMFKALLNRHMHEVDELESEGTTNDLNEIRPAFGSMGIPDGESSLSVSTTHESEDFRSPFSYPQADEPFHA